MARSAQDIARAEVIYCVSGLVSTLANCAGCHDSSADGTDLADLAYQALELAAPVPDYESAAREAGWLPRQTDTGFYNADNALSDFGAESWQTLCHDMDIEPYDREVFEHWIVTDWLADKLEAKGEKVDRDFAGMTIWARTTTGQAISMDSVIAEIAADLAREYGE